MTNMLSWQRQIKLDNFWLIVKFYPRRKVFFPFLFSPEDPYLHDLKRIQRMKMSSLWWTLVTVLLVAGVSEAGNADTTAYPVIPQHLIQCYMDDGIYHRANRMPSTLSTFVDLITKVEASQTARNLNARELSMVLLHYLKLDGIHSIQSHAKFLPNNILPFAPSGDEYFKHRLTLVGLVARIDQGYMAAINESLTQKEMCNLHFLLSYSVDPYKRDDERCNNWYENNVKPPIYNEPRSEWDPHQRVDDYYYTNHRRFRRRGEEEVKSIRKREVQELKKILKKRSLENLEHGSGRMSERELREHENDLKAVERLLRRVRRHSQSNNDKKAEVEAIPPQHPGMEGKASMSKKGNYTIGNQELLSDGEAHHQKRVQSLIQGQQQRYGSGPYSSRTAINLDEGTFSGVIPGIPLSDCPVVNGIVKSSYGSLSIGSVIAGIAAGLNPEDIPPTKLSVSPSELESPSDRVRNVWATTLAGTVADTISSPALLENLQIIKGGWNDTDTKWYLLKSNQFAHLTDVAIRGSLDGLYLGTVAKEWTNRFSNMKLSQMLQTYYNGVWNGVGARERVKLRTRFVPDDVFRKQVHLMSLVLKKQKKNFLTVTDYSLITKEAVAKVTQYIQTLDEEERGHTGILPQETDNSVNFVAVVDSSWGYENLVKIFQIMREAEVACTPMQSNLTIVCGSSGKILMWAENSVSLYSKFTKESFYGNCTRGMNLHHVFDSLELLYRKILNEEKISDKMNTDAQVVALFPFDSLLSDNVNYAAERSRIFQHIFPDVRLMVAPNGRSDTFLPMVKDPKDVIPIVMPSSDPTMASVKRFAEGVKLSYQRISRPSCGSYFDDDTQGNEVRVTRDVRLGNIAVYRLMPNYFFTVRGQATITIRSKLRAPLTICHSREMFSPREGYTPRNNPGSDYSPNDDVNYNPNRDSNYNLGYSPYGDPSARQTDRDVNDPVQCKTITSETYRIELDNPCDGASTLAECRPLYISLSPPLQQSVSINRQSCPLCRLPTNVEFEMTASGLTCYNSAAAIFISPLVLCFVFVLSFSNIKIF